MRVSSRISPLSVRGTLKSTRRKTRLPLTSRSVTKFMSPSPGDVLDEIDEPAGIAPLVVVPGDDLDQRPVEDLGREQVDDAGVPVAHEVRGDERLVGDAQVGVERPLGRGLAEGGVDLLDVRRLFDDGHEVDDGDVGGRDADGEAVDLALELGHDQADGLGRAGRRRDLGHGRGPGPAQVLVGGVEDLLVVRVRVYGGHEALLDAEDVVQDLDHGGQAVGRAGGVGDDVVLGGIVRPLVDAEDQGGVGVRGRSGDDDLVGPAFFDVLDDVGALGELARGFDDDGDAEVLPGKKADLFHGQDLDLAAADHDRVLARVDVLLEGAQYGVVLEQVGQGLGVGDVVDGHIFDGRVVPGRPQHVPADAAETVYTDSDSHTNLHFFKRRDL